MNMVTLAGLFADAQPAPGPSPELIKSLADLIKVASASPEVARSHLWLTPEGLSAIATFIAAVCWPLLVISVVLLFRRQLADILDGITEVEAFGIKAKIRKIQRELNQSAQAAEKSQGLSNAPSPGEIKRAIQVEQLTTSEDLPWVRQQVDQFAAEYEHVRNSALYSDARTRAMEVVVAKMRTIGLAAYPLRW